MAKMYPNRLAEHVESEAEKELYHRFRDDLDSSYVVFHGVNWQMLDGRGRPRDGEADFIIAHPQRGIIILEVKGGTICCDPCRGQWTSTDRSGREHTIKDPFYQARYSKYALQDALEPMLNRPHRYINLVDAVAFPDTVVQERLPGLDKPREIIMDQVDLLSLSAWVGACLAYSRGPDSQRDTAPGEAAMEALMQLLGKRWELRPVMWGDFQREQEQFIELTHQQYQILDMLNRHRRALISGCAGSGKTLLAVEKAQRLANQKFRVLFTCFNKSLAADLRSKLPPMENFGIIHFHDLCTQMARQAGIEIDWPPGDDPQRKRSFYDDELPEKLLEAADRLRQVRYDAIVVDEGQDFLEHWWIPILGLLRDSDEGILYIFYDDNQRIYGRLDAFPVPGPPFTLTVNCRNTQEIHRQVIRFYDNEDEIPTARGPVGRPVEIIKIPETDRLLPTLQGIVDRLVQEEQVPAGEIVILSPLRKKSQLPMKRTGPTKRLLANTYPPPEGVYMTTIHDFKGLESAVIILVEAERWPSRFGDLHQLLYVGCSRARNHLIAILPQDAPREIQDYFG